MIAYLYLAAGALIAFYGVFSFMDPERFWSFTKSAAVSRVLSTLCVLVGATLMAQGFAHFG